MRKVWQMFATPTLGPTCTKNARGERRGAARRSGGAGEHRGEGNDGLGGSGGGARARSLRLALALALFSLLTDANAAENAAETKFHRRRISQVSLSLFILGPSK